MVYKCVYLYQYKTVFEMFIGKDKLFPHDWE